MGKWIGRFLAFLFVWLCLSGSVALAQSPPPTVGGDAPVVAPSLDMSFVSTSPQFCGTLPSCTVNFTIGSITQSGETAMASGVVITSEVTNPDGTTSTVIIVPPGGIDSAALLLYYSGGGGGGGDLGGGGTNANVGIGVGETGYVYGSNENGPVIAGFYQCGVPVGSKQCPIGNTGSVGGAPSNKSVEPTPANCPGEDQIGDFDGELERSGCCRITNKGTRPICSIGSRVQGISGCSCGNYPSGCQKVAKYCISKCGAGTAYTPTYSTFTYSSVCGGACLKPWQVTGSACGASLGLNLRRCISDPCMTETRCNELSGIVLDRCGTNNSKVLCKPAECMTRDECLTDGVYPDIGARVVGSCDLLGSNQAGVLCIKPDPDTKCLPCDSAAPSKPHLLSPSCGSVINQGSVTFEWDSVVSWGKSCGTQKNTYDFYIGTTPDNMTKSWLSMGADTTSIPYGFTSFSSVSSIYWKIVANNGQLSTSSDVCQLLTGDKLGWWQTKGAGIYAGSTVKSELPDNTKNLIEPSLDNQIGALLKASGSLWIGSGNLSSEGYTAKTKYRGKTMDYAFFAANMGVVKGRASDWTNSDKITLTDYPEGKEFGYMLPPSGTATVESPTTVGVGEKYIVFVNGDLEIKSSIQVANRGFLAFIVSGNIKIDPSVTMLQGIYLTSSNFTTLSAYKKDTTDDVPLEVEGSVIAWGLVSLNRNLGPGNATIPAEKFTFRPDLLTNMPDRMKTFAMQWNEVVAGTYGE